MYISIINITGERDNQCKDPEVGIFLDSLRNTMQVIALSVLTINSNLLSFTLIDLGSYL